MQHLRFLTSDCWACCIFSFVLVSILICYGVVCRKPVTPIQETDGDSDRQLTTTSEGIIIILLLVRMGKKVLL